MSATRSDQDSWFDDIIEGLASELPNEHGATCPVCGIWSPLHESVVEPFLSGKFSDGDALYHWGDIAGMPIGHWFCIVPDGLSPIPEGFEVVEEPGKQARIRRKT